MIRSLLAALALAGLVAFLPATGTAAPKIGAAAPGFTLVDLDGKERSLAEFAGRTVVLEWTNDGCPFVQKHYDAKNMQALQQKWIEQGVVWLVINTSAPGKQGHVDAKGAKAILAKWDSKPTDYLFDTDGKVGKAYDAKVTPHMYVIDAKGTLVYMGGIDDKPSADPADIPGARNHVDAALTEIAAGKPVGQATSRPYGCSVKYAD